MTNIDIEFIDTFLDEAEDILEIWESSCLSLLSDPSAENLDALFRSAHNLKGSSRSVGLEKFGAFVHVIEDVIEIFRSGLKAIDEESIEFLLASQTFALEWITAIRTDHNADPETKNFLEKASTYQSVSIAPAVAGSNSELKQNIEVSSNIENVVSDGFGFFDEEPETVRGNIKESNSGTHTDAIEPPNFKKENKAEQKRTNSSSSSSSSSKASNENIRISKAKLDELIRIVGEISIQDEIIWHSNQFDSLSSPLCQSAINLVHKALKELQDVAFSLRLQPVQSLFQRLERTALDVARKQNKKILIEIQGDDVELDKSVIERVKDPLVHILRNAVDHGVENPESRKAQNKPEIARIQLIAANNANGISITIKDDGKGLDREKIHEKALEKGLIETGQKLSDNEINNLILQPGFSTADIVTDISGRGVGMDVVQSTVLDLGGSINIESEKGKGSSFEITLPSNLSILDALVIKVANNKFALPVQDLVEIVDLKKYRIQRTSKKQFSFNLRNEVVPIEDLSNYLPGKIPDPDRQTTTSQKLALITSVQNKKVAFEFESVLGQQPIVIHALEENLAKIPGINGSTILSNGEPGFIINLPFITRSYLKRTSK